MGEECSRLRGFCGCNSRISTRGTKCDCNSNRSNMYNTNGIHHGNLSNNRNSVDNGTYAPYSGAFTGISSGLHKVWVKNAAGCEGSVDVTVGSAPGAPSVTATATDPTCTTPTGSITVTSVTTGLQ